jgi:hypothetical protein
VKRSRADIIKDMTPDYTCPTVNPVIDFLAKCGCDDHIERLKLYQRQNGDLRAAIKMAVRYIRELESEVRRLENA